MDDDLPSVSERKVDVEELRWILDAKVRALGIVSGRPELKLQAARIAQQLADLEIP